MTEEGDVRIVVERYERRKCDECDELAVFKFTWLLEGFRHNPASTGYGRDDCTYCSDLDAYRCRKCAPSNDWLPDPDGYLASGRAEYLPDKSHSRRLFMEWHQLTGDEREKALVEAFD